MVGRACKRKRLLLENWNFSVEKDFCTEYRFPVLTGREVLNPGLNGSISVPAYTCWNKSQVMRMPQRRVELLEENKKYWKSGFFPVG